MKKIILILLFFLCQTIFCQEYYFDRFYEYNSKDNVVCFFMLNSLDKGYLFYGTNSGSELSGYIFDYKKVEFHYYKVANSNNNITFDYINSRKIQSPYPDGIEKEIQYDYTITKIDSAKESIRIVRYKQKRKRTNLAEVELIYDKNNSDYVFHNSALLFFSHHLFDKREIENVNNRLPNSISYDFYNGNKPTFELTKKQKINTSLIISKDQINYKQ